jgi:hypothetical protein
MQETLEYIYNAPSVLTETQGNKSLELSTFGYRGSKEIETDVPFFFQGKLLKPYLFAKTLRVLSKVVAARFHIPSNTLEKMIAMKDPIVTVGDGKVKFEGLSVCNGVYAKLDLLQGSFQGDFFLNGTTNVDFNRPMQESLSKIVENDSVHLAIGSSEVILERNKNKVVEKKVPLPKRWIKSLSSVQVYLADMEKIYSGNRIQAIQLFRTIPKMANTKSDFGLAIRGDQARFTAANTGNTINLGGIERLRLLDELLPLTDNLTIYSDEKQQATAWQLNFDGLVFTLVISHDVWRGFSGEGQGLDDMLTESDFRLFDFIKSKFEANHSINPTILAIENDIDPNRTQSVIAKLASQGLLGFDLQQRAYYYRELPFDIDSVDRLNPRVAGAKKIIEEGLIQITKKENNLIEASVKGSDVTHCVQIVKNVPRCTCTWFAKHQGQRGDCKHVLALRQLIKD